MGFKTADSVLSDSMAQHYPENTDQSTSTVEEETTKLNRTTQKYMNEAQYCSRNVFDEGTML